MKEIKIDNHIKIIIFSFVIINLTQLVINIGVPSKTLDLDYSHALSLINGNVFIIHKNGVIVYNYNFTSILYNYDFGGNPLISSETDNNFTSLIQCYDDNNKYVLALINDKIYIFSSRGQYLFHTSHTLFSNFTTDVFYHYYSFLYYKYEGSIYYFIVTFIDNQNLIKLIEFQLNINSQSFSFYKEITYNEDNIVSDSVSCQIINSVNYSNVLSCFYFKKIYYEYTNSDNIYMILFNIEDNFEMINETIIFESVGSTTHYLLKSNIGKGKNKVLVGYISPTSSNFNYFVFDFDLYQSNSIGYNLGCLTGTNLVNIEYFNYLDQFILSCKNSVGIAIYKIVDYSISGFDGTIGQTENSNCTYFISLDIIFLLYKGEFNLFTNFLCEISNTQVFNFPNHLLISEYDFPSDEPDSYYFFSNYTSIPSTTIKNIKTTIPSTTIKNIKTTIPITTIKNIKTTTPITTIKNIKTTIPITTIKNIKTTIPITTIKNIKTTIPITTIKNIKTTIPITTIKNIKTTIPITTIKNIKTTIPITTIKNIKTTTPITTIKKIKSTTPITTVKNIKTTISSTTIKNIKTTIPSTTIKNIKTTIPITTIKNIKTTIPITIPSTSIKKSSSSIPTKYTTTLTFSKTILHIPQTSFAISKDNCKLKCLICNEESSLLNLCIQCNTNKEYYPSLVTGETYVECYNQQTKPSNYFFNSITKYYEPCYSKCKTCDYQGNEEINNCTLCKNNYIFRPDLINSSNCVMKCNYYYYIIKEEYFCTENNQCPIEESLLIRNKGRCVDNCNDDNEYIYQFNYECLKECPEDTIPDEDNICKLKDKKKCYLYSDSFLNVNYNDLESNNFISFIKRYIIGFEDTDFHVDFYQSQNYTITIYKEIYCLKELEMNTTIIDFGECYEKIQKNYKLEGKNLIILISDFFNDKQLINTLFYFFNPETGEKLSIDEICSEEKFIIEKSLNYYPEINIEQAKFFEDQNINIFNSSDVFYNDLCIYFESPNGKDVPLKERLLIFYPNVSLCDDNCVNAGVNLTSMKAICECTLKELLDEAEAATKLVGLDFVDVIDSLSLDVVKCYKTLFQLKYFIRCYGGFISIFLIIGQTICVIIVSQLSMYKIRKTTFSIVEKYSNQLSSQNALKYPPKKRVKTSKNLDSINFNLNSNSLSDSKNKNTQISLKNTSKSRKNIILEKKEKTTTSFPIKNKNFIKKLNNSKLPLNGEINLKEYLITSMDDLDYDDLIVRDKRSFWKMFFDKLIVNQKIIDLFANNNWIIPKSIKVIFLIVMIDLYFLVNALFYNEDYIIDLYYSDEEETFFSFIPRSLNRIMYTSLASSVLDFIISLLFPTENKIKKILIRKKNNIKEMKNKVLVTMENIINNYWIFIVISYLLTIYSWYYISCFNNVYPYLKIEWIKSSIFIFIIIQLIIVIGCFLFSLLRFISIKCKSERLYRISNYFFS